MNKKIGAGILILLGISVVLAGCKDNSENLSELDKELEDLRSKYKVELSIDKEAEANKVEDKKEKVTKEETDSSVLFTDVTKDYNGDLLTNLENYRKKGFLIENNIVGINNGELINGGKDLKFKEHKYKEDKLELYFEELDTQTNYKNKTNNNILFFLEIPKNEVDSYEIVVYVNNTQLVNLEN